MPPLIACSPCATMTRIAVIARISFTAKNGAVLMARQFKRCSISTARRLRGSNGKENTGK